MGSFGVGWLVHVLCTHIYQVIAFQSLHSSYSLPCFGTARAYAQRVDVVMARPALIEDRPTSIAWYLTRLELLFLLRLLLSIVWADQGATHRLDKHVVVLERLFPLALLQMHLGKPRILHTPAPMTRHLLNRLVQHRRTLLDDLFLGLLVERLLRLALHLVEKGGYVVGVEERVEEVVDCQHAIAVP